VLDEVATPLPSPVEKLTEIPKEGAVRRATENKDIINKLASRKDIKKHSS
jgi:hypothetical protein